MKKVIIMGASSGLGLELAKLYIAKGCTVGIAGRRTELLQALQTTYPGLHVKTIDVNRPEAPELLEELIADLGGMDLYIHSSGIGHNNPVLDPEPEIRTTCTNVTGFTRLITAAFNHFTRQGGGHLAAISSIAGTKGLGAAPAYSASKRYQSTYLSALRQQARLRHCPIRVTDIRPGFVRTPLIEGGSYPLQLEAGYAARKIFSAIEHRRRTAVIDWRYALLVGAWQLLPNWLWERLPVK